MESTHHSRRTPWTLRGCRDLVDMLERLPAEIDGAIMEHAGSLTQFLHGRLPQPISEETLILLWTEAVIADDIRGMQLLPDVPQEDSPPLVLAHTQEMVAALKARGLGADTIQTRIATDENRVLNRLMALVLLCPKAGPLLLPYAKRIFPDWHLDEHQRNMIYVATAAAGDGALVQRISRMALEMEGPSVFGLWGASRLGHRNIVRMILSDVPYFFMSVQGAVLSNARNMFDLIISHTTLEIIDEPTVGLALGHNFNDLAQHMIELRLKDHDVQVSDMAAVCVWEGNLEVLRAIATAGALESERVGKAVVDAAGSGWLKIVRCVFETTGKAPWACAGLAAAAKGGWVDVTQWLLRGPAAALDANAALAALAGSTAAVFEMVLKERSDLRPGDIMNAAAAAGNLVLVEYMRQRGFKPTGEAAAALNSSN